jgi:hypothetical protein
MSILSERTERKALLALARTLKYFEKLDQLKVSNEDAFAIRHAENLINGTIESNGYRVVTEPNKGTRIQKEKSN